MKHIVSRMSSYFPNRWPISYLNLTINMKTYIRRHQHKKLRFEAPFEITCLHFDRCKIMEFQEKKVQVKQSIHISWVVTYISEALSSLFCLQVP